MAHTTFIRTFILRSIRNRLWWVVICVALVLAFLQLMALPWLPTVLGGFVALVALLAFIAFSSYQRHRDEI